MEAREGASSQLSELGQWRPERVPLHSCMDWGSGGQRGCSFIVEWIGGAPSQLSEVVQWKEQRVLIYSCMNWSNEGQRQNFFAVEWTREDGGQRGYFFTAE